MFLPLSGRPDQRSLRSVSAAPARQTGEIASRFGIKSSGNYMLSDVVRQRSLEGLENLGYSMDLARNAGTRGVEADLSGPDSRSRVLVVPTYEELMIAKETFRVAG